MKKEFALVALMKSGHGRNFRPESELELIAMIRIGVDGMIKAWLGNRRGQKIEICMRQTDNILNAVSSAPQLDGDNNYIRSQLVSTGVFMERSDRDPSNRTTFRGFYQSFTANAVSDKSYQLLIKQASTDVNISNRDFLINQMLDTAKKFFVGRGEVMGQIYRLNSVFEAQVRCRRWLNEYNMSSDFWDNCISSYYGDYLSMGYYRREWVNDIFKENGNIS